MNEVIHKYDAVIIGGGFYGAMIALHLSAEHGIKDIAIIESENSIMKRASLKNQARVHLGPHYPRNFVTANRSRQNFPRFVKDWPLAIFSNFDHIYAISRIGSKTTSSQFINFCEKIGIDTLVPKPEHMQLLNMRLIEQAFLIHEPVFDAQQLAHQILEELNSNNVQVFLGTTVNEIWSKQDGIHLFTMGNYCEERQRFKSKLVFNCTYAGLAQFKGDFSGIKTRLRYEMVEIAMVSLPPKIDSVGMTIMDGPYFSFLPFPSEKLTSFSHVKYSPHHSWTVSDYKQSKETYPRTHSTSNFELMQRDATRFVPTLRQMQYHKSQYEIKVLLKQNDKDDGRPILFEEDARIKNFFSILGSKLDNVYDAFAKVDEVLARQR